MFFSGLFATEQPIGVFFPGEDHFCIQLSLVVYNSLYGVEDLQAFHVQFGMSIGVI